MSTGLEDAGATRGADEAEPDASVPVPAATDDSQRPDATQGTQAKAEPDGVRRLVGRTRLVPWLVALSVLPVYLLLSITRFQRLLTESPDLGIFEQAIKSYSQFKAPIVDLKAPGFNLLGDHFHPLLVVMAPFYRIWPSAVTILTLQAILIALSVVPVTRAATRRLGTGAGIALGMAYAWSWGLQSAVDFDFHEICLAVPILAFALEAVLDRRFRTAALLTLLLLGVKEELTMTVVAVGLVLFLRHRRLLGIALVVIGLGSFWLIVWKIIPHFNPDGVYPYRFAMEGEQHHPWWQLPIEFVWPRTKLATIGYVLGVTGFVALRSPISLIAIPTLAWRFHSQESYWGLGWQYNAILMPIMFLAAIEVLTLWRGSSRSWLRQYGGHVPAVAVAVAVALTPSFPFARAFQTSFWQDGGHVAGARAAMAMVPDGASVQANVGIQPQLVHRTSVFSPGDSDGPTDYIIIDSTWDGLNQFAAMSWAEETYPDEDYRVVFADARWTVLRLFR